ncbi:hypothetical protein NM688_g7345 [Phlebia brevispora]|uniref:Uncharacterized protein n=1 Tax=Phlebia brevispora TaxID=194682 RepID=A0ACC1S6K1_9APHY|nr:hypothetical protein NM688_g7345 [Phlebia brevispora]
MSFQVFTKEAIDGLKERSEDSGAGVSEEQRLYADKFFTNRNAIKALHPSLRGAGTILEDIRQKLVASYREAESDLSSIEHADGRSQPWDDRRIAQRGTAREIFYQSDKHNAALVGSCYFFRRMEYLHPSIAEIGRYLEDIQCILREAYGEAEQFIGGITFDMSISAIEYVTALGQSRQSRRI